MQNRQGISFPRKNREWLPTILFLAVAHSGWLCAEDSLPNAPPPPACTTGQQAGVQARLVQTVGRVERMAAGGQAWQTVGAGTTIQPGDRLRTNADSQVALVTSDESLIRLKAQSELVVEHVASRAKWVKPVKKAATVEEASPTRLNLQRGGIWLMNKDRATTVDIQTIHAKVGIRGTELSVQVSQVGDVHVATLEGFANVDTESGSTVVGHGEELVVGSGGVFHKTTLLQPENAVQWTIVVQPLFGSRWFRLADFAASGNDQLESLQQLRDQGQLTEAERGFRQWVASHPAEDAGRIGLAWVLLDRQQYAEALTFLAGVKSRPRQEELARVIALIGLERFPEARAIAAQGQRDDPVWTVQRMWIDMLAGSVVSVYPKLEAFVASHPSDAGSRTLLAIAALARNRLDEGLAAARGAAEKDPASASAWVALSYLHQAAFDLEAAEQAARHAMELDPAQMAAWLVTARLAFGSDRTEEAQSTVELALDRFPQQPDLLALRGFIHLAQRRDRQAEMDFQSAVGASPGLAEACMGMGLVLMRQGLTDEALEAISTSVTLEPRRALLRTYWAKMLHQVGRHQKALDVLGMAKELDARDPSNFLYEALILRDLRRPTEAVAALQQAIALNDNRAVYRSRMLLDSDRAVKNVDLSLIYRDLGLQEWARSTATASLQDDITNPSAHLFYTGSLQKDADRSWAHNTESLLARLLQPANENTFNNFNNYTSMFERPAVHGGGDITFGRHHDQEQDLFVFGASPEQNLAYMGAVTHLLTNGWGANHGESQGNLTGHIKWEPLPNGSLMGDVAFTNRSQGGVVQRYEYDAGQPARDGRDDITSRIEAGYHHHAGVGSDYLFHAIAMHNKTNQRQTTDLSDSSLDGLLGSSDALAPLLNLPNVGWDWAGKDYSDLTSLQDFVQVQASHLARGSGFQWQVGGIHFAGEESLTNRSWIGDLQLTSAVGNVTGFSASFQPPGLNRQDRQHDTLFLLAATTLDNGGEKNLTLEGGLSFDRMETGNLLLNTQWTVEQLSPRLGAVWHPVKDQAIRLAAFRSVLPNAVDRLDPSNIAGIPILRNGASGVVTDEADIIWEKNWSQGFGTLGLFHLDRNYGYRLTSGAMTDLHVRMQGGRGALEWILADGVGGFARYRYMDQESDSGGSATRQDHLGEAGLKWIHSSGWSAKIQESVRHLDFNDPTRNNETMWITDLETTYDFQEKLGYARITLENLFDSHFNWVVDDFVFMGREPAMQVKATLSLNW